MSVPASSRERKSYWISLVSLLAAVPLAVLVGPVANSPPGCNGAWNHL